MGERKPRMAANVRKIQTILEDNWDPIGVRKGPEATDEYDRYVMPIYLILRENRSEGALLDYLKWMLQRMGLAASSPNVLGSLAVELLKIDVSGDE